MLPVVAERPVAGVGQTARSPVESQPKRHPQTALSRLAAGSRHGCCVPAPDTRPQSTCRSPGRRVACSPRRQIQILLGNEHLSVGQERRRVRITPFEQAPRRRPQPGLWVVALRGRQGHCARVSSRDQHHSVLQPCRGVPLASRRNASSRRPEPRFRVVESRACQDARGPASSYDQDFPVRQQRRSVPFAGFGQAAGRRPHSDRRIVEFRTRVYAGAVSPSDHQHRPVRKQSR